MDSEWQERPGEAPGEGQGPGGPEQQGGPEQPGGPEQQGGPEQPGGPEQQGGRKLPGARALTRAGYIEYDRVVFFSDAVFAIAITLLAVNLHVPATKAHVSTAAELSTAVPGLLSFGISFAVIGLFWLGHHAIFRYIVALDRPLIGLNLLFLGTIAFLPYPTAVLSVTSGPHPGAVVFYAACAGTAGLTESAIWVYATFARDHLTDPSVEPFRLHFALRIARIPVVFYASIPLALVAPALTPYFWILIWVSGIAINRLVPGLQRLPERAPGSWAGRSPGGACPCRRSQMTPLSGSPSRRTVPTVARQGTRTAVATS